MNQDSKDSKKKPSSEVLEDPLATALRTAREELTKLKVSGVTDEKIDNYKQTQSKEILEQSAVVADQVLKRLVAHTVRRPMSDIFDSYLPIGQVRIEQDGDTKNSNANTDKYVMYLALVDKDYMLDLGVLHGDESVKQRMIFLLNAVKVLYCPIKDYMQEWAADNNTAFEYILELGDNTTMYFDPEKKKRIGIILKKVNVFPT
jgi:hypothetical protein